MSVSWQRRLTGFTALIATPIAFAILLYVLSMRGGTNEWIAYFGALFLFLYVMFGRVTYEPRKIRRIDVSGLSEELRSTLLTTTSKGEYINLRLVQAFKTKEKLSQTDLYKEASRSGIELTQPAVRDYILELERRGLISSPTTPYAKEYALTEMGRLCLTIVTQLFPERYWLYVARNELGIRRIPRLQ